MSLQINMNSGASAQGGVGVGLMTAAGNPWTVPDALAAELVNRGVATAYNWPANNTGPLTTPELGQIRGVVSKAGIPAAKVSAYPIEISCPDHKAASTSGLATTTWQQVLALRAAAYAVRVTYYNQLTSAVTFDKTAVSASSVYTPAGDPTGSAWTNVLWSGAASVTVGAAPSAAETTFGAASDWALVSPLAWAASSNPYWLYYLRTYQALSGGPYHAVNNVAGYTGNAVGGLARAGTTMSGDKIASPSGFVGVNPGLFLPMLTEWRVVNRVMRVAGLGDSITSGNNMAGGGQLASFGEQACNIANANALTIAAGRYFSYANFGWESQTHTQLYARLPALLAAYQPDVVLLPIFSPNAYPTTQAQADADVARVLDGISRVRAAGALPIPWTGLPRNSMDATSDGLRKANNVLFLNYCNNAGLPCAHLDSAVSDGGSPAQWISGLSADGLHPNDAGTAAIGALMAAKLLLA